MDEKFSFVTEPLASLPNIIPKANVSVKPNHSLTNIEKKLIVRVFSSIQSENGALENACFFDINEMTSFLGLNGKSAFKDLRDITLKLMRKAIEIEIGGSVCQVSFLSYVGYNENEGTMIIRFDPFWSPYISSIKRDIEIKLD